MTQTKAGGKKTAAKLKAKYGENYFIDLARRGGKAKRDPKTRHFAKLDREKLFEISSKGGRAGKGVTKPRQ